MAVSGIISGMQIKPKNGGKAIPVYPAPWSVERKIEGVTFGNENTFQDLGSKEGNKGLLDREDSPFSAGAIFVQAAGIEAGLNAAALASAGAGLVLAEVVPAAVYAGGDEFPDLMGPGRGDVYFGEGWTLGLQNNYILGIEPDGTGGWKPKTTEKVTYDILSRSNQYIYMIRDIENIITDLNTSLSGLSDGNEKTKLQNARGTWQKLLNDNLAYQWQKNVEATIAPLR